MECNLLILSAIEAAIPDVESAVFLAEIVESLTIGAPNRSAVFASKVGKFGVLALRQQPYVAADRRLVVFAEHILATLLVVIKNIARLAVDVDIRHGECRIQTRTTALKAYLVELWELRHRSNDRLRCRHIGHAEDNVLVVSESHNRLAVTAGCEQLWFAALARNHIDVEWSLAVRNKSNLTTVGTPDGVGVVSRI